MTPLTRRQALVAGGTAAAGAGSLASSEDSQARRRRRSRRARRVDVAVVGAGLAGLSAARRVAGAGRSVVVLEARRRVGGRTFDADIGGGHRVELGGQWAGPGQDRVLALAEELGIATFETYAQGESVYYANGSRTAYSGDLPPANPVALAELVVLIERLNAMAAEVPPGRPWDAPGAATNDMESVGSWAEENLETAEAKALVAVAIEGVYGAEPGDVSLLDLLAAIASAGGDVYALIDDAQTIRFVGGPQQLSGGLAHQLGRRVKLGTPVRAIRASGRRMEVVGDKATWQARQVIVAVPRMLAVRIRYSPALPAAHDQLGQRQPMGSVIKCNAVYDEPFWRSEGLSGVAVSDTGPIKITYDNSPPEGRPGVLIGFMEANAGRPHFGDPAGRRQAALESFARYFGEAALRPRSYVDLVWAAEPWTRGAYGPFNPPGVLTGLRDSGYEPVGRIHWAGAELSAEWTGYMDGALRSGESVAEQVLAAL